MMMSEKQLGYVFWRRFQYLSRVKHVSYSAAAKAGGYTIRGFMRSKAARACPRMPKLFGVADILNVSLEELCDPRIPVDKIDVGEPYPILNNDAIRYEPVKVEYFKARCLKDTSLILGNRSPDRTKDKYENDCMH